MTETELNLGNDDEIGSNAEDHSVEPSVSENTDNAVLGDDQLRELMEAYEGLKDKMDAMQAERNALREQISGHMQKKGFDYTEVPVSSGRAYKVSWTNRIFETVTREGKSFIKVHATPELLDSLIKTAERETLAIREMTGVPRQSLFNRLNDQE